ncbi:MAG: hypothetical protein JW873_03625 [Candidatus Saganbacteria bacterium]|nr:hypothetical protein [Candidatus Saganbacteria bacterium]
MAVKTGAVHRGTHFQLSMGKDSYRISKQFIDALKSAIRKPEFVGGIYLSRTEFYSTNHFSAITRAISRHKYLEAKKHPLNVVLAILDNMIKMSGSEKKYFADHIFPMLPLHLKKDEPTCFDLPDLVTPYLDKIVNGLEAIIK